MNRLVVFACAIALGIGVATPSYAQSDDFKRATESFEQGSKLFLDKRYEEALDVLQKSYALYPSPNSLLLIARCERDLGRPETAAGHFSEAAAASEARVTNGEKQYEKTADSARREGAAVRATLGTLRVRVEHAPSGAVVETRYSRALLEADGSAELAHRAGTAELSVRAPSGRVISQKVEVKAHTRTDVSFDFAEPKSEVRTEPEPLPARPAPDRPARSRSGPPGWMLPTGSVLAGIGVVGLGSFGYFGAKSRSTYNDLADRCGPSSCGPADRDQADRGKREQTIANVSLAVGSVALATGVTLIVIAVGGDHEKTASRFTPRGFEF